MRHMGKKLWIGTLIAAVLAGGLFSQSVSARAVDSSLIEDDNSVADFREIEPMVRAEEESDPADGEDSLTLPVSYTEEEAPTITPDEGQAATISPAQDSDEALLKEGAEDNGMHPVGYSVHEKDSVTYIELNERVVEVKGYIEEKINSDAVTDIYLVDSDGNKAALTGNTSVFWESAFKRTEVTATFGLYRQATAGTYQMILKDKEGNTYPCGQLIATDQTVVTGAFIEREYDNYGSSVYLRIAGVNLGTGDRFHPSLTYQGKTMTKETGEAVRDGDEIIYRLQKLDMATWESNEGIFMDLQISGGENKTKYKVNYYTYIDTLVEHIWYDPDDGLTHMQFMEGLQIPVGTEVSVSLGEWNEEATLFGSGKMTKDHLLNVKLKDKTGKVTAPVEVDSLFRSETQSKTYTMTVAIGNKTYEHSNVDIFCYPKRSESPLYSNNEQAVESETGGAEPEGYLNYDYGLEFLSSYAYTDEQKIEIIISGYREMFDGYSGELTATLQGHTAKLAFKEGPNSCFAGTIDLGSDRLSEGVYSLTLKKGDQTIGSAGPLYAIDRDKPNIRRTDVTFTSENTINLSFESGNLLKEYFNADGTPRGIDAKTLWENGGYCLEAFAPDGTPVALQNTSLTIEEGASCLTIPIPMEAWNYTGLFLRLTRNGQTPVTFDDDNAVQPYYSGYLQKWYFGNEKMPVPNETITDQRGQFIIMIGQPCESFLIDVSENPIDQVIISRSFDLTPIQYPIHAVVTKVNRTKPECTFTIREEDMVWDSDKMEKRYNIKAADVAGLSENLPYSLYYFSDKAPYKMTCKMNGYIRAYKNSGSEEKLTGVTINERSPEVGVGQTMQLSYEEEPWGATVNNVSWTSSNTKIATVDKDTGLVHGISEGEAKITLTADGKKDSVTVRVVKQQIPLTGITLDRTDLAVKVGETKTIGVTKTPENATETVSFASDHPEVAVVSASGVVNGLMPGTATITVSGGQAEPKQCLVTVTASLQSLRLDQHSADLYPNDKLELTALVSPAAEGAYVYTWDVTKDHEKDIVSYAQKENGKKLEITALTPGSIKITVTAADADDPTHSLSDSATIWVTGTDLMNGTESEEAAKIGEELEKSDNPSGLWIADLAESYEYNGVPVEPNVAVYAGRVRLRLGKDYTVACKNNRGPGTGILTINGKGSYKGKLEQDFLIVSPTGKGSKSIKKATMTLPSKGQYAYTGSPVTPEPVVSLAGETLTPGTDYTLTYFKNTDAGTGYVLVTGIGDYTDAAKKPIKILPVDLSAAGDAISVKPADAEYRSAGAVPDVVITYTAEGKTWTLRNGVDYKLNVKNNKKTGTATLNVNGLGNFKKSKSVDFKVVAGDLGSLYMDVPDVEYKAKQKIGYFMSKVKVYDENGKALKQKTDYTLNYFDLTTGEEFTAATVVSAGDQIRVTAVGQGNYAGSVQEAEYRIVAKGELKNITKVKPDKIPDQIYNAGAKTPNVIIPGLNESQYEIVGYSNNTEKGTGRVFVRGTGDYCGLKILTFKIVPADAKTNYLGFWRGNAFVKNGH